MNNDTYAKRIEAYGGKVTIFDPIGLGTIQSNAERFRRLLRTGHYDVVHCHMANAAFVYLRIAQQENAPIRILHSHQDHYADTRLHAIRNVPLVKLGKQYANYRVACSQAAGRFLFGSKQFTVIKNGIDFRDFHFDQKVRDNARNSLKANQTELLVGQVGRLVPQKNPLFSIRLYAELQKVFPNSRLIFAGDGPLRAESEHLSSTLGLSNKVIFLGNVEDVDALSNALDVLLMPSLYEGVGLSLLEAQATGLPSFASSTIPPEAFVTSFSMELDLKSGTTNWAQSIADTIRTTSQNRETGVEQMREHGYDAKDCTELIESIYAS